MSYEKEDTCLPKTIENASVLDLVNVVLKEQARHLEKGEGRDQTVAPQTCQTLH
jgi:hypothetical protein